MTAIPSRELQCPFIRPEVGITCTPAIDPRTGTLYALARTRETDVGGGVRYAQRLHALDVRTGAERDGSPVEIQATVRGSGDGSERGTLAFDPLRENPRASLLLTQGVVVLCWASSCDVGPYHGWVMAFDARTLAADAESLRVTDSFTPFDQAALDAEDGDLGSGGPVLAGGDATGPACLVFASKAGKLYVLDPQRLGGYHAGSDTGAVQSFTSSSGEYGAPAYWNGHVYIQGSDAPLREHTLRNGRLSEQPVAQSAASMPNPGATPAISAHGTRDGIVWMIQSKPFGSEDRAAILRAFDAANVGRELWTSEQNAARDRAGVALRFTIPAVCGGRVYVGTRGGVDVYGLLQSMRPGNSP